MSQIYAYDSFGNMNQVSPGTAQSNLVFNARNQISTAGFTYDLAGDMTQANIGSRVTQTMAYDAEHILINLNQGAAAYIYDADVGGQVVIGIPYRGDARSYLLTGVRFPSIAGYRKSDAHTFQ